MNRIFFLITLLVFASCQSSKQTTEVSPIPDWVQEYPISNTHYVGIGIADKSAHPQDYIKIAQQNALQNLMSQIKVTISSQSVFLQMDRDYGYEEDFKSNIQVQADDILEGYELVSTFTQNNEYWVYYRLSKTTYFEKREARISEAIEESKYHLSKAILLEAGLKERYVNYVKALSVLEPYLGEPLNTKFDRENVYLGSEIIARFRSYIDDFQVYCLTKKINAMVGSSVKTIDLAVEYKKTRQANIPLITVSKYLELKDYQSISNQNGVFTTSIPKIKSTESVQNFEAGIDFKDWIEAGTESPLIQKLFKSVKTHQIIVPVYVYTPTVFVKSTEKYFGKETTSSNLRFAAESALSKLDFTPVGNSQDAQLFMTISADSEKGKATSNQKMFTAYVDLNIQVKDLQERIVYSKSVQKIKGIQLDFDQANSKAYQQVANQITDEIIPDFVDRFIME